MSANGTTMLQLTMPVHQDVIDRLYEHCVTQKLYNKRKKRWTGMPSSTSLPKTAMYQLIQAIGQCIHDACQDGSSVKVDGKSLKEVQHGNDRVETVNGIWNVLPNRAPRTQDSFASDTRPDIDFSMDSKQRVELSAEIDKYLEALRERSDESKMKIPMVGATEDEITGGEASTDEDEDETHEEMRPEDESSEDENGTIDQNEETAAKEYIKAKEAQLNEAMQRWWMQLHTLFELKRKNTDAEVMTATSQVITGLRRILREQLNRRFAFGVTLCKANFRVWLCDRSGLVGMRSSIDMDKNPKAFIRVMAAFSILRPEELGWDPTMRLYRSPTVSLLPYLVDFEIENYNDSVYHTRWAIEMPGKEPHTRETFITVKCLSAAQADGADGRGTIVWEAVRKEEIGDPKELFVLKQSWYPSDDVATRQLYSEAQMYKRVFKHLETLENPTATTSCQMSSGDPDISDQFILENIKVLHDVREELLREASTEDKQYISDVYSSEDVCINGDTDTTFTLIRRRLALYEYNVKPKAGAKRDREKVAEETRLYGIFIEGDKVRYSSGATRTVSRTHNRLLQSTHGWPINFFLDLKELLQVLRDGIKGHKFLYLLCWILHRDISMGNIVISAPLSYDPEKHTTIGRLIDLDHAKAANRVHSLYPLIQEADAKTGGNGVEEPNYGTESEVVRRLVLWGVDAKVARIVCHRILEDKPDMNSEELLNAAFSYITPKRGPIVDRIAAQKPVCRPDFQSIPSRQYERTGTVPFMSAEVMLGEHQLIHQCHEERLTKFTHHAVHDVESFFWVLLYICLTRKGPGGARRDELNHVECPNEYTKTLRHIILCLFNAEWANVAQNKTKVLKSQELLENNIIPYIHGYFEDIRGLIRKWHALLQRAHRYHLVERDTIHDQSLELIEEALVEVEKKAGSEHELTKKERERRKAEMTRILKTCRDTSKSSSTGPHTEAAPSTPPQHDRTLPFDRTPQTSATGGTNAELTVAQRPKSPESPLAKRSKTGNAGTLHRID